MITIVQQYKDYVYKPEDDYEEDNIKRFHSVYKWENNVEVYYGSIPLSPYVRVLPKSLFSNWIDMGQPTREELGGHHTSHHKAYYDKWIQEQLEKELELES